MKKNFTTILKLIAFLFVLPIGFSACSNDDDDVPEVPQVDQDQKGVFVYNSGSSYNAIDGSLSFIYTTSDSVANNVFFKKNNRSLGATVQTGTTYKNNLYIAVSGSNTIEVVDKISLASIAQILPSKEQGNPRDIEADDNYLYVSMMTGFVSRINPTTNTIDKTIQVGPNPEEMAVSNGYLYVVNSDGFNYKNNYQNGFSVSKINLSTFTVEKTIKVGMNPTKIAADNNGNLYVLCMGDYNATPSTIYKITKQDAATDLAIPATLIGVYGNNLYVINYPFYTEGTTYKKYDLSNMAVVSDKFIDSVVDAPAGMGIDPETGEIYISSYSLGDKGVSYAIPGYLNRYDKNGKFVKKYSVGVGPCYISFLK